MASRFVETDEEFIEELRNTSENKNTKRRTDYWTKIFQQWAKTSGKMSNFKATKYQRSTKPSITLPIVLGLGSSRANHA